MSVYIDSYNQQTASTTGDYEGILSINALLYSWIYKGKKYLHNSYNEVWTESEDMYGDWQGVYLPTEDRFDNTVPEPDLLIYDEECVKESIEDRRECEQYTIEFEEWVEKNTKIPKIPREEFEREKERIRVERERVERERVERVERVEKERVERVEREREREKGREIFKKMREEREERERERVESEKVEKEKEIGQRILLEKFCEAKRIHDLAVDFCPKLPSTVPFDIDEFKNVVKKYDEETDKYNCLVKNLKKELVDIAKRLTPSQWEKVPHKYRCLRDSTAQIQMWETAIRLG